MTEKELNNSIFVVNEEPYCLWEVNLRERNIEFLNGIDIEYFDYAMRVHLESEDEKRASMALRIVLYHALETFLSFAGAYIQAPDCAYAWIAKCSNKDLRGVVKKINIHDKMLFTKLNIHNLSWEDIAKLVFCGYKPNSERNEKTVKLFSALWQKIAHEYCDENQTHEYNSFKHGFRVRPGGFALAVGTEDVSGVSPSAEKMQMIGRSDYGSSFFKIKSLGKGKNNRNLTSTRFSINWKIEKVILLTQLVSMSINNIVSALKIANGIAAEKCKFLRPEKDEDFEMPWQYSPGVTYCSMDLSISEEDAVQLTREELLRLIDKKRIS